MALEILELKREDPKSVEWARGVFSRQVTHLTRLVDDLLDVGRITTGKVSLRFETADLRTVVQETAESMRSQLDARTQSLNVELADEPVYVRADPTRLAQVVTNLIGNASKYTLPGGEIAIDVSVQGAEVAVSIKDNGTGISREALPHIFELYAQDVHVEGVASGGLGIGLAVVRELVTAHEGSIVAVSDRDRGGSEFVVRLPLASVAIA
jgi:signal transduction histidine kinase